MNALNFTPTTRPRRVEVSRTKIGGDRLWLYRESQTNRAIFKYTWTSDVVCEWDMLSEVSQHFLPMFQKMIDESQFKLSIFEDDENYYNILVPKE